MERPVKTIQAIKAMIADLRGEFKSFDHVMRWHIDAKDFTAPPNECRLILKFKHEASIEVIIPVDESDNPANRDSLMREASSKLRALAVGNDLIGPDDDSPTIKMKP